MAELAFWLSIGILIYIYAIYPIVLQILKKFFARPIPAKDDYLPAVSMIIAAYNEADVIEEKVRNSLKIDYPKDRFEIIVASDGSDDGTNEIVKKYLSEGVVLNEITPRGGKTRALNLTIPTAKHDIIVFSDANTMYTPNAIRELVKFMHHPNVGGVTGDVKILNDSEKMGEQEGLYYKYERNIQLNESLLASIIGVDGAMYALKKAAFTPPTNDIILDDFVTSMNAVRNGYRVLYNPKAKAYENATPTVAQEIRRRVRITAGGMQALLSRQGLPAPGQWLEWWMYLSHKLLRWFTPVFMLIAFVANAFLLGTSLFWDVLFAAQCLFYFFSLLRGLTNWKILRLFNIPFFFCMTNYAALIGIFKGLFGIQKVTWKKADREKIDLPEESTNTQSS